jgi:PAS domain S-box-containing protein
MDSSISVLHVDDDLSITDLTATFLEREDDQFTVETAASADEGFDTIRDRPPDCIVSDYDMPSMNGIEFLQAVREDYPDLPFILFTGKGSEVVASEAIAADVTGYLQKESGSEQYKLLANRIRNSVQARRETQRADRKDQLMRLTEFVGDTGGFEMNLETGEVFLTDGAERIIDPAEDTQFTIEAGLEQFYPEDREEIRRKIDRAYETGEQTHGTWRYRPPGDGQRLLDVTLTAATTNGDKTTLRGAIHDVTERRERKRELRTERRFIKQALDALDDLFYVLNTDGSFRRSNERFSEVTGYTEHELGDMHATALFPEDERERVAESIDTTLTDGRAIVKADILTADGDRLPYEFTGTRLTDADGNTVGLVGIGRDVTERK